MLGKKTLPVFTENALTRAVLVERLEKAAETMNSISDPDLGYKLTTALDQARMARDELQRRWEQKPASDAQKANWPRPDDVIRHIDKALTELARMSELGRKLDQWVEQCQSDLDMDVIMELFKEASETEVGAAVETWLEHTRNKKKRWLGVMWGLGVMAAFVALAGGGGFWELLNSLGWLSNGLSSWGLGSSLALLGLIASGLRFAGKETKGCSDEERLYGARAVFLRTSRGSKGENLSKDDVMQLFAKEQ